MKRRILKVIDMWWTIAIVLVVFLIFLWAIIAGTHKENSDQDYEDQQIAIEEWRARHNK